MKSNDKPGMVNVGTIGHIDHGKKTIIVGNGLPPGTYDAIAKSVGEEDGVLFIDFKTTGSAHDGKTILMYLANSIPPDLPECHMKPHNHFGGEQSWQAMNKGGYSKKQRRGKL